MILFIIQCKIDKFSQRSKFFLSSRVLLFRPWRLGYKIVVVIGHPGYYPRFGFLPARDRGLEVAFPVPDEAFMVLELVPGALDVTQGEIIYPPEFHEVS
jgi:predicted N-acetyltransferase YhbS